MSTIAPVKTTSFSCDANKEIYLRGGKCRCGYIFFPFQGYGCEMCGATGDHTKELALVPEGELVSSTTVFVYKGSQRVAPFMVGAIRLKAGPVIRVLIDHPLDGKPLLPGQHMFAVQANRNGVVPSLKNTHDQNSNTELQFVATSE